MYIDKYKYYHCYFDYYCYIYIYIYSTFVCACFALILDSTHEIPMFVIEIPGCQQMQAVRADCDARQRRMQVRSPLLSDSLKTTPCLVVISSYQFMC